MGLKKLESPSRLPKDEKRSGTSRACFGLPYRHSPVFRRLGPRLSHPKADEWPSFTEGGACDVKGFLACVLAVLDDLEISGRSVRLVVLTRG